MVGKIKLKVVAKIGNNLVVGVQLTSQSLQCEDTFTLFPSQAGQKYQRNGSCDYTNNPTRCYFYCDMDADNNLPLIIPHQLYERLQDMDPEGAYGVSYDVYTRKTEADLPSGWNARRASTYLELRRILGGSGFHPVQYSDWASDDSDAVDAYWTMLNLLRIRPPGKLESTIKGLKAHHIPSWELDITDNIQLGGIYAPNLRGPTPANLVPRDMPAVIPEDLHLPEFTKVSPNALNLENWRVSPP